MGNSEIKEDNHLVLDNQNREKNLPIGIFDSGLGGISVLSEIYNLMPEESYIYYGDSINAPYGTKTSEEINSLTQAACEVLIEKGVKAIVIACNTATSIAITNLRDKYDIPIIGMEPAIKVALNRPTKKKILVMATSTTLREEKFNKLVDALDFDHRIIKVPCPELVEDVENNKTKGSIVNGHIRDTYEALEVDVTEIDAIVLGCTHFIFVKEALHQFYGKKIRIIDGNRGTANHLRHQLEAYQIKKEKPLEIEKNISLAIDENRIQIINTKSEELLERCKFLAINRFAQIKDVLYEDEMTEEEKINKKLMEFVEVSLDEIVDNLNFNEVEELIFSVIYGREKGKWDLKSLSKELNITQKRLKIEIKKVQKKVFNYMKLKTT